jgi:hypothetical protein
MEMNFKCHPHAGPAILLMTLLGVGGMLLPGHQSGALAANLTYSFSTGTNPVGSGPIGDFPSSATVSGTFTYDPATPAFGLAPDGSMVYRSTAANLAVGKLSALVNGVTISDTRGSAVSVGDNLPFAGGLVGPADILNLSFEPPLGTGTHDIVAPVFGGFSLVNVRMFWIQGQNGIAGFLNSQNMPVTLPGLSGRLALDFIPTGSSSTVPTASVFFDGVQVAAVPEPDIYLFMLAGLAVCAQIVRRRNNRCG